MPDKEYEYKYFNSEYSDYYSSLSNVDNSEWAASFKNQATQAKNIFENEVKGTMNEYAGKWEDAVD